MSVAECSAERAPAGFLTGWGGLGQFQAPEGHANSRLQQTEIGQHGETERAEKTTAHRLLPDSRPGLGTEGRHRRVEQTAH
jgi:hypothetical protein